MAPLHEENPRGRFTGLADVYARCRPDYPEAALDFIVQRCQLTAASLLVDIGCGTGISSRLFARRGVPVVGIEPNAEMRGRAEQESLPPQVPLPTFRDGTAEATGLPDATAAVVLAAQAFHWFEPNAALREFSRILKPGGWVVLMWNERDNSDAFTAAYSSAYTLVPGAEALEMTRGRAGEPLLSCPFFAERERLVFQHAQMLDEDGVLGRAFSASYAPRDPATAEVFARELRSVFARFQEDGRVRLCYETSVYVGRRPL